MVLKRHIRDSAFLVGAAGIGLAILLSGWLAARVTRPVERTGPDGARGRRRQLEFKRANRRA